MPSLCVFLPCTAVKTRIGVGHRRLCVPRVGTLQRSHGSWWTKRRDWRRRNGGRFGGGSWVTMEVGKRAWFGLNEKFGLRILWWLRCCQEVFKALVYRDSRLSKQIGSRNGSIKTLGPPRDELISSTDVTFVAFDRRRNSSNLDSWRCTMAWVGTKTPAMILNWIWKTRLL